jgi:hypothetical protein
MLDDYTRLHKHADKSEQLLALQSSVTDTTSKLEAAMQENELLFLQLHQVQEELESTFLGKKQLEQHFSQVQKQQQELTNQVDQANQEQKEFEQQEFNTAAQAEIQQELEAAKQETELLLLQLHQVQEELEHYFLEHQKLCKECDQLKSENNQLKRKVKSGQQQKPESWLKRLVGSRNKPAVKLDYEGVQLLGEQVNPDYEHLWIKLKSPSFGDRYFDEWSFRISCAGVKPNEFGKQPKLEFPEQPEQLLKQWFSESESEDGRKLELRFALPNAMDTGVWKQINIDDRSLITSLVQQLPAILQELKGKSRYLSRSWEDWQQLAVDVQRILNAKLKR